MSATSLECRNTSHIAETMDEMASYEGRTIVVKIGGNSIAEDDKFLPSIAKQLEFLQSRRVKTVLIHGGGPQIDEALARAKITTVKGPDGRRITDPASMSVISCVMSRLGSSIGDVMRQYGCKVFVASENSKKFVTAKSSSGHSSGERTGIPDKVDTAGIHVQIDRGEIALLSSVGYGEENGFEYNVNADDYAMAVAVALKAKRLILATNVSGVYDAEKRPISVLTPDTIRQLKEAGVISGGMVPKVESALRAIASGVGGVAIINGHHNWAILEELLTRSGSGTLITG